MRFTNLIACAAGSLGACLVAVGCKSPNINWVEDDAAPGSSKVVDPATTRGHMHDHFDRSLALLSAVIDGDLERVRSESYWLAYHRLQPSLHPWKFHLEKLRVAARPGARAQDISSAARVTARVGASCGECHALLGIAPNLPSLDTPARESSSLQGVQLHVWAADRMWEGLIAPSEELWNRGVTALAAAPLEGDQAHPPASPSPELVAQARAVHALADEGRNATTPSQRVVIFARFLENCASCHRKVGMARSVSIIEESKRTPPGQP